MKHKKRAAYCNPFNLKPFICYGVGSIGDELSSVGNVATKNGGAVSCAVSVRVNPERSPIAAPVTTVPPVTSAP